MLDGMIAEHDDGIEAWDTVEAQQWQWDRAHTEKVAAVGSQTLKIDNCKLIIAAPQEVPNA